MMKQLIKDAGIKPQAVKMKMMKTVTFHDANQKVNEDEKSPEPELKKAKDIEDRE